MTVEVWGCKGTGSVIAEAFLTLAQIPFTHIEVNYDEPGPLRDRLRALNPLGQVPTLLLPNGVVLTETLAVAAYAHAKAPTARLIPDASTPEFVSFWRWAAFIVGAVYPTFTYGDDPTKWIKDKEIAQQLRTSTDQHRCNLWMQMEEVASLNGYFLGETFSALDIYLAVMVHWRPRQKWFEAHTPKIAKIAAKMATDSRIKEIWRHNFSA